MRERPFTIYTNHQALAILKIQQNPKGCKVRWIAKLKNYNFKTKHWSDNDNDIADYLFRNSASEPINYVEDEQMYSKFIRVVEYDEDGIWMFIRFKNLRK